MKRWLTILLLIPAATLLAGSDPIRISGTVTDHSGKPVKDAVVRLARANAGDTTDEMGNFRIDPHYSGVNRTFAKHQTGPVAIRHNDIVVNLTAPATIKITLFTVNGRLVQSICSGVFQAGSHCISLKRPQALNIGILRCEINGRVYVNKISTESFQFGSSAMENSVQAASIKATSGAAADTGAAMDMLEIRHPSFTPQKYLLNPYRDSVVAVSIYSIAANWITQLDSMYIDQEVFAGGLDNGNYLAMGETHSPAGDYDICFFTLDPTGMVLTKNIYGGGENELGFEFVPQNDGTVRVFGDMWYTRESNDWDVMTMSASFSGDSLNSQMFTGADEIKGGQGALTPDGGFIISGYRSFLDTTRGNCSVPRVTRVKPDGAVSWTKEYAWPYYYSLNSDIVALSGGGFVLAGYSFDDTTLVYAIWLLKIDENGTTVSKSVIRDLQRPWVQRICETDDHKLFLLGKVEIDNKDHTYIARFSSDCSLEWDTTILDETKLVGCMTPLKDGSFLMAYNQIISQDASGIPEEEAIGMLQIKTDGIVVKEVGPIRHFGHPRSVALGKDNSIVISSASGYTFRQQEFFIINVPNAFVE